MTQAAPLDKFRRALAGAARAIARGIAPITTATTGQPWIARAARLIATGGAVSGITRTLGRRGALAGFYTVAAAVSP